MHQRASTGSVGTAGGDLPLEAPAADAPRPNACPGEYLRTTERSKVDGSPAPEIGISQQ